MSEVKEIGRRDPKSTGLKKCFTALVDRKQVNLDMDVLNLILKKELLINVESLDAALVEILPVMLVVYMKNWPGWQKSREYFSGKLNFKEWYEKFRQYIVLRLNYLVKNGYKNVVDEMEQEKGSRTAAVNSNKAVTEHGSQTDALAPKTFSPFNITIRCLPIVINSIVFSDSGDDIVIRQHPDMPWANIETKQLLHWPNIEVEFCSPELSFKRKNCFDYNRYINFINMPLTYEKAEYIDQVNIINSSNGRNCYSLNMLRCYVKEYLCVLKSIEEPDINLSSIEILLNEFLQDIVEIDMNQTMATNTSVVYNIGKCMFLRNKKIPKSVFNKNVSDIPVGFSEIITPKLETSLMFFKGIQDLSTPEISFAYLNIVKNAMKANDKSSVNVIKPVIVYKCTFCQISFKGTAGEGKMVNHLKEQHKMDPNVLCIKCKKSFSVNYLANARWKHICTTNPVTLQQYNKHTITI